MTDSLERSSICWENWYEDGFGPFFMTLHCSEQPDTARNVNIVKGLDEFGSLLIVRTRCSW